MVSLKSVEQQMKKIGFNHTTWGRSEIHELPHILMPDEEIFECVNGFYEGGFALLVATNFRVLLIDKKPLNYLTVEDLRFDMINEIDYSHRLFGARVNIATGSKNLKFTSYNQARLRKLITLVQHCMAENKKKAADHNEDQNQHLENINQQLQAYLMAQMQYQEELHHQFKKMNQNQAAAMPTVPAPSPSPELSDYLFARSLLAKHGMTVQPPDTQAPTPTQTGYDPETISHVPYSVETTSPETNELFSAGVQEVFGKQPAHAQTESLAAPQQSRSAGSLALVSPVASRNPLEVNPLTIAYSKLPMALRNRRFGRPSFHAHSEAAEPAAS